MIRPATEADVSRMLAIYAPYVTDSTCSFEYEPPTAEEFLERFRKYTRQFPWLVWEEAGQVLGYAYASAPFDREAYSWCAGESVYLCPDARGRGIGRKLLLVLEEILARQGYRVVYAVITGENTASRKFHEKLGYRQVGDFQNCGYKFGRWVGVVWLEKCLNFAYFPIKKPGSWLSIIQADEIFADILSTLSLS